MMLPEDVVIGLLAGVAGHGSGVSVGIGDDAAVLDGGVVISADMLVEGVHFDRARLDAEAIGARAAGANLSDLAAMGAEPLCLIAALGLPEGFDAAEALGAGLASYGVPLAGGDLSRAPVLTLAVTAVGRAERPVLRSGGRAGDVLVVTGELGAQALTGYTGRIMPRLAEGRVLARMATAMLDISDGIAEDAPRLASASGTGAEIHLDRLPCAAGATVEQAAGGGEDYELLAALPPDAAVPAFATVVGRLTETPGVRFLDAGGIPRELHGWDHFR